MPFFRPAMTDAEIAEVLDTLRSGWLTTGPKVRLFEKNFAEAVGAKYAIALNSCTAALHLAVEGLELRAGEGVLVPTMTFAATAEILSYMGAVPILVDCDPTTLNMDLEDAERKLNMACTGELGDALRCEKVVGIIPVHVGGFMLDVAAVQEFARLHSLWIVDDAAHSFPAAWRQHPGSAWQRCGESTAAVSCFSFYANKTITTGEGGMATTDDSRLAERMKCMSLHGLSHDAWGRYSGTGSWDYRIVAPGFKYNLTDVAAAIGIHQLARAEEMRRSRDVIAEKYQQELRDIAEIELPPRSKDRIHSWHLFPIKLNLQRLTIPRNAFIDQLKQRTIGCSVHWRPLHLHPYYETTFGWKGSQFSQATAVWERLISLPIFPGMTEEEIGRVVVAVREICASHAK